MDRWSRDRSWIRFHFYLNLHCWKRLHHYRSWILLSWFLLRYLFCCERRFWRRGRVCICLRRIRLRSRMGLWSIIYNSQKSLIMQRSYHLLCSYRYVDMLCHYLQNIRHLRGIIKTVGLRFYSMSMGLGLVCHQLCNGCRLINKMDRFIVKIPTVMSILDHHSTIMLQDQNCLLYFMTLQKRSAFFLILKSYLSIHYKLRFGMNQQIPWIRQKLLQVLWRRYQREWQIALRRLMILKQWGILLFWLSLFVIDFLYFIVFVYNNLFVNKISIYFLWIY